MTDYQPAALFIGDETQHRRQLALVINDLQQGRLNVVGTVTLRPSQVTTAVFNNAIHPGSFVALMPLTANAAAALPSAWFAPAVGNVTINHASSAHADQTFSYLAIG